MLHTNNPIIKHKAGLLNLAEEQQNVSKVSALKTEHHKFGNPSKINYSILSLKYTVLTLANTDI